MPRPAGISKTGGRKEGTPNKATATREAEIRAAGMTPLEFMLGVMRDDGKTVELRLEAAAKAAPYIHPRLSSVALGQCIDVGARLLIDCGGKDLAQPISREHVAPPLCPRRPHQKLHQAISATGHGAPRSRVRDPQCSFETARRPCCREPLKTAAGARKAPPSQPPPIAARQSCHRPACPRA